MSPQHNGKPLSRIQQALHEHIPGERDRSVYREVAIRGRTAADVAKTINESEGKVHYIAQRVRRWLEQIHLPINIRGLQALHLQRLEHQWHEAMSAWYRSGQPEETYKGTLEEPKKVSAAAESTTEKAAKSASGDVGKHKVERTRREPCGDVRYLEQARKIMAEYRSLSSEAAAAHQKEKSDAEELSAAEKEQAAAAAVAAVRDRQRKKRD